MEVKEKSVTKVSLLALSLLLSSGSVRAEKLKYVIEPNHSSIGFSVPIMGGFTRVTGKFNDSRVEILFDEDDLPGSSVQVTIKVDSIDTGIEMRDKDLRGESFFATSRHPEISFRSRRIEKQGEDYLVTGDLSMRGIVREVALPCKLKTHRSSSGRIKLGVSIRSKINRLDYDVGKGWKHTAIPNFVGEEIEVLIDLWTRSGKPPE